MISEVRLSSDLYTFNQLYHWKNECPFSFQNKNKLNFTYLGKLDNIIYIFTPDILRTISFPSGKNGWNVPHMLSFGLHMPVTDPVPIFSRGGEIEETETVWVRKYQRYELYRLSRQIEYFPFRCKFGMAAETDDNRTWSGHVLQKWIRVHERGVMWNSAGGLLRIPCTSTL